MVTLPSTKWEGKGGGVLVQRRVVLSIGYNILRHSRLFLLDFDVGDLIDHL